MSSPVGGFFPIPLAMMIPFMATQSLIMGDAFGRSFQYGKRKISAMSNDEFNSLTTEIIAEQIYKEYKNIIPNLNQSLVDSQELQNKVIDELLALPSNALANLFAKISGTATGSQKPTYIDPNDPSKDFAPPPGKPYNPTPASVATTPPPRRTTAEDNSQNQIEAIYQVVKQRQVKINNMKKESTSLRNNPRFSQSNQDRAANLSRQAAALETTQKKQLASINQMQQQHKAKYGKWIALV